jgi:excisionase family DNA binding protein
MGDRKWLKPIDVARLLGIRTRDVYRLIDEGELPAYRFGRIIRLLASDVDEYRRRLGDADR